MLRVLKLFFLLWIGIVVSANQAIAQRSWMEVRPRGGNYVQRYQVLESLRTVRDGEYQEIVGNAVRTQGFYVRGKRDGAWQFGDPKDPLYFNGSYSGGAKHGRWKYFIDGYLGSETYYRHGAVDSAISYYEDYSVSSKRILDSLGNGKQEVFYPNGNLQYEAQEQAYQLNGEVKLYFPDGRIHRKLLYFDDRLLSVVKTFDREGIELNESSLENGRGRFVEYEYRDDSQTTELRTTAVAFFEDSLLHGAFEKYWPNGLIEEKSRFERGKKVGVELHYNEQGLEVSSLLHELLKEPASDRFYAQFMYVTLGRTLMTLKLEQMPAYPGGDQALLQFLSSNVQYPQRASDEGIQGEVRLSFIIDEEGDMMELQVERSVSPAIDAEAMRVVKLMPRWDPGMQHGKPVRVQYHLPMRFTLKGAYPSKKKKNR